MTDSPLEIYTLFPTPLLVRQIENFYAIKDSLVQDLYEYEEDFPKRENFGGCTSPIKAQLFHVEKFQKYFDFIVDEIRFCLSKVLDKSINITHDNIINSWANINRRGDYNYVQVRPRGRLTCVLFVSCPYRFSGNLVLKSPHTDLGHFSYNEKITKDLNLKRSHIIEPFDGKLVIFPSSVYHYVESNQTDMDRITIAMDIDF